MYILYHKLLTCLYHVHVNYSTKEMLIRIRLMTVVFSYYFGSIIYVSLGLQDALYNSRSVEAVLSMPRMHLYTEVSLTGQMIVLSFSFGLLGSADFLGLQLYTSNLVTSHVNPLSPTSYYSDGDVKYSPDPSWER